MLMRFANLSKIFKTTNGKLIPLLFSLLFFHLSLFGQINSQRLLDNGRNALFFQDYALAIDYFNRVAALRPTDPHPFLLRAIAKIQLEDFTGAVRDCNLSLDINPYQPTAFYARGFANNRLGDFDSAIADFTKALEFSPANATYHICRSESFFNLKQYQHSLQDANQALQSPNLDKKEKDYLYMQKCNLLLCKSDTDASLRLTDSLIASNTLRPEMYSLKGLIFLMRQQEDSALAFYDASIKLGNQNANTFYNRAILRYQKLRYDSAITDLSRTIALTDSSFRKQDIELHNQAFFSRATIRHEVGDLDNCMNDLDTLLLLDPDNDNARYLRATIALSKGLYRTARSDFQYLIDTYPHFVPAYYGAAKALGALGAKRQENIYLYKANQIEQDAYRNRNKGLLADTDVIPIDTISHQRLKVSQDFVTTPTFIFETNLTSNEKTRGEIQNLPSDATPRPLYCIASLSLPDALGRDNRIFVAELDSINNVRHTHYILTCTPILESILDENQSKNLPIALKNLQNQYLHYRNSLINNNSTEPDPSLTFTFNSNLFPIALYNQATFLLLSNQPQQASLLFSKALSFIGKSPSSFRANLLYNRALSYIKTNQIDKAILDLSEAGNLGVYQSYSLLKKLSEK